MEPLSRQQPHYFGAGPALLPTSVLQRAAQDLVNYQGIGIGLGELSHRSKQAIAIIDEAKQRIAKLVDLPDTHEVFFAQGGGTGGFASVALNMAASYASRTGKKGKADYIVTGSWSQKAAEEAQRLGLDVNVVVNAKKVSSDGKYGAIPPRSEWKFSDPAETAYIYYCDNETVNGVEFPEVPEVPEGVELVADMSSNVFSRPIDVSRFGLIFAGAQKNIGIAGVSLYIIKKSLLERASDDELRALGLPLVPIFLDFPTIVKNNSAYNTISIFAVYIVSLTMQHLLEKGGLAGQAKESADKAAKVYATVDKYPSVYVAKVDKAARSRMNIVFTIAGGDDVEKEFLDGAAKLELTGLKGHRSVGGIRVSNYNAVEPASVDLLVKYMTEFAEARI